MFKLSTFIEPMGAARRLLAAAALVTVSSTVLMAGCGESVFCINLRTVCDRCTPGSKAAQACDDLIANYQRGGQTSRNINEQQCAERFDEFDALCPRPCEAVRSSKDNCKTVAPELVTAADDLLTRFDNASDSDQIPVDSQCGELLVSIKARCGT
jgi:hypothetical protein